MSRWEYKFDNVLLQPLEVGPGKSLDGNRWLEEQTKRLNDLGGAGWELVQIFLMEPPYPPGTIVLRRPYQQAG